ncbi:tyrosine-type recombinase/integrase [Haloarcula amylolytica]|uniref:tyrosine-type recombinase/integrase n=1 Tax=Haloarcula amylolytica TaxID=396317 RepID=UPI003C73D156
MQVEPYDNKSGYRVWLSDSEQQQLLSYYDEHPEKQLAIELMLDGLRADEVPRVSMSDFRKMNVEEEGWMLHVWESKTNYRECPVSNSTVQKANMLKNVRSMKKSDSLVDASKRTVQRWVTNAAKDLSDGEEYWESVTAHDLRRTWCTHTYWSISGARAREVVMSWGGWDDVQTFSHNYLGKVPDSVAIDIMDEAGLRE